MTLEEAEKRARERLVFNEFRATQLARRAGYEAAHAEVDLPDFGSET